MGGKEYDDDNVDFDEMQSMNTHKEEKPKRRVKALTSTEYNREHISKEYFGGNREAVIQRDGERCVQCGMTREAHRAKYNMDINVDHINGKGYNVPKEERDNRMENLQTLCSPCHCRKDIVRSPKLSREITINGVTKTYYDWVKDSKVDRVVISGRLSDGWEFIRAISVPSIRDKSEWANEMREYLKKAEIDAILALRDKEEPKEVQFKGWEGTDAVARHGDLPEPTPPSQTEEEPKSLFEQGYDLGKEHGRVLALRELELEKLTKELEALKDKETEEML